LRDFCEIGEKNHQKKLAVEGVSAYYSPPAAANIASTGEPFQKMFTKGLPDGKSDVRCAAR
jgi:hypothetical protein